MVLITISRLSALAPSKHSKPFMAAHSTHSTRSRHAPRYDWFKTALVLGGLLLVYYLVPVTSLFLSVPPAEVARRMTEPTVVNAPTTASTTGGA